MDNRIKGDFHFHSLHSACQNHNYGQPIEYGMDCGRGAVREMIEVGRKLKRAGFEYLAVTNHATDSISLKPANRQEIKFLVNHLKQINELNKAGDCDLKILAGVEVNILNSKGELNVLDSILEKLDIVIASNHRPTDGLERDDIKKGFIQAANNPNVDIMGHLNRFIKKLTNEDWQEIIRGIEKNNKIIEFNLRAPLSHEILKLVAQTSLLISLGSDAHPEIIRQEHNSTKEYIKFYLKRLEDSINYLSLNGINPKRIINTHKLSMTRFNN